MNRRLLAQGNVRSDKLCALLAHRFALRLDGAPAAHLAEVQAHYRAKRALLLMTHGEAGALACADYAKAVLVSEAARLLLREIDPRPRRTKKKKPSKDHSG